MLKQNLFPILMILIFFNLLLNKSSAQNCGLSTAQIDLDVNTVHAMLQVGGDLWWNGNKGRYIVPKPLLPGEPEVSAFFVGGLWLGGYNLDSGGNLKIAAQTYGRSNGDTDYWPGPLSVNGTTTQNDCNNFDRFWIANSTDINMHKADWDDNGIIDDPIPLSILAWPAHGNTSFEDIHGFEIPDTPQGLAPFIDRNGNGIYEPESGDFPNINGADQGIWWVFNDAAGDHTESGGNPLQFEIQVLAYSFLSSNDNINNATFYDYKFINRASETIDTAFVGLWVDPDLGCFVDDYFGCYPENNLAYIYNMDALDGVLNCNDCQGVNTYCEEIPLAGIKILSGVKAVENGNVVDRGMSIFTYYNNGGLSPPPPPGTDDPGSAPEYYRYLSGSWKDGTRFTYGGDGHDPVSVEYTNYAFPGPPNDSVGWSMCSEGFPGSDRRMLISSGPFDSDPGAINNISFAVIFVEDVPHPCPDISPLLDAADDVQELFDNIIVTSTQQLVTTPANIQFQPNPMNDQAELIFNELENAVQQVTIFSIDGKQMRLYDAVFGKSLTIERNDLGPGMYFYKIQTDDFKVYGGRFIVQ